MNVKVPIGVLRVVLPVRSGVATLMGMSEPVVLKVGPFVTLGDTLTPSRTCMPVRHFGPVGDMVNKKFDPR